MSQKMWEANSKIKSKSNLFAFEKFLAKNFNYKPEKNYKKLFKLYSDLHDSFGDNKSSQNLFHIMKELQAI